MKLRKAKGFTLIELMIVVAIIGILAAIAIPKFADLIRKSKEGATKGNLGSLRSAVTVYYAENEFYLPATSNATFVGNLCKKYLEAVPTAKLGQAQGVHTDSNNVTVRATFATVVTETGGWNYTTEDNSVVVDCAAHTDTKNTYISTW
ncbi:MAG: type II secretion system protein [Elusimicrobiota bacterium]